ncbi:MAG: glycosyltransferase [Ignavibacteriales bacterium]|nr:MAG: glycosyltransferase [Ignavibacteriales bacterium]
MIDEISRLNSKAKFFWHRIPINIPVYENGKKNIDIIYFGRVTRQKGAEDFIKVIGIIVKKYPGIKAGIAGPIDNYYKKHLLNLAAKNGCLKNITFLGFFPTQLQLHKIISGAKIYLFPTYNDTIPGTIVEAMFLRVMIITYQTGGIPDFNDSEKIVEIVPQGDFEKLAERAIEFLEDDVRREEMMSKAYEYVLNNYGFERPITELVNIYKEIAGNNGKTASQKIKQFETKVSLN